MPPEQYTQPNQYAVHETQYQQQKQILQQQNQILQQQQNQILSQQNQILPQQNQILPQQNQILPQPNIPPQQYYNGYQQQLEVPTKGIVPNAAFESQKFHYQPEVVVGNQIQSVQQKAVTEKYTKSASKGNVKVENCL